MTKMKHFLFTLLAVAISISTFTACNNDNDNNKPVQPQLPEAQITEIVENAECTSMKAKYTR